MLLSSWRWQKMTSKLAIPGRIRQSEFTLSCYIEMESLKRKTETTFDLSDKLLSKSATSVLTYQDIHRFSCLTALLREELYLKKESRLVQGWRPFELKLLIKKELTHSFVSSLSGSDCCSSIGTFRCYMSFSTIVFGTSCCFAFIVIYITNTAVLYALYFCWSGFERMQRQAF